MDRGIDTRSPIAKKSMQPRMLRMFSFFKLFFYCVFFTALFLVIAHTPLTRIMHVEVEGGNIVPSELVQAYVVARITRSATDFLPQDSIVSISRRGLEHDVLKQFKMIQSIKISTQGLHTLRIVMKEHTAAYTYCDDRACVALSDSGEILAPVLGAHSLIVMRGDIQSFVARGEEKEFIKPTYGQKIVHEGSWNDIVTAIQALQKNNFNVQEVNLLPFHFFTIQGNVREQSEYITEFRMRSDEYFTERLYELGLAFENGLRARATQEYLLYVDFLCY